MISRVMMHSPYQCFYFKPQIYKNWNLKSASWRIYNIQISNIENSESSGKEWRNIDI